MRPGQEVHGIAVFDHYAFRQTGRARCVDQVRQMRGSQPRHLRILDGFVLPVAQVKIDDWHRNVGQQALSSGLNQHCGWRTVLQHVGNTFYRIRRIQWYITAARLEDRQQADDHLHAAFYTDTDPRIRLHALFTQGMGQAVGLLVKLAIGQALFAMDDCHPFQRALYLRFEHPVNGLFVVVIQRGVVERHQQLLALGRRQDRQTLQRCFWRLLQRRQQVFQCRVHIAAYTLGTD